MLSSFRETLIKAFKNDGEPLGFRKYWIAEAAVHWCSNVQLLWKYCEMSLEIPSKGCNFLLKLQASILKKKLDRRCLLCFQDFHDVSFKNNTAATPLDNKVFKILISVLMANNKQKFYLISSIKMNSLLFQKFQYFQWWFYVIKPFNDQCSHHIETNWLVFIW